MCHTFGLVKINIIISLFGAITSTIAMNIANHSYDIDNLIKTVNLENLKKGFSFSTTHELQYKCSINDLMVLNRCL